MKGLGQEGEQLYPANPPTPYVITVLVDRDCLTLLKWDVCTSPAYYRLTLSALRRVAPLWPRSELLTWPQVISWCVPSFNNE